MICYTRRPFTELRLPLMNTDIFEIGINIMVKNSWDFLLFTTKQKPYFPEYLWERPTQVHMNTAISYQI